MKAWIELCNLRYGSWSKDGRDELYFLHSCRIMSAAAALSISNAMSTSQQFSAAFVHLNSPERT